jgi:deoxyribodipyrimidine photo-lyase
MKDNVSMLQVVWFKHDLRTKDHQPLSSAAKNGKVLALYVFEPDLMMADDYASQHYGFAKECLLSLKAELKEINPTCELSIEHADVLAVLKRLLQLNGHFVLWSHEETGNDLSFLRDRAVGEWCRQSGITWHQIPNNGVVRRLRSRDVWSKTWTARMTNEPLSSPTQLLACDPSLIQADWPDQLRSVSWLEMQSKGPDKLNRQRGGLVPGNECLRTFFVERCFDYRREMSSPLSAQHACSRLSTYLAFGVFSIRQVITQLQKARAHWMAVPVANRPVGVIASLKSFESRLHWHCHFIQKLESEPRMEFRNVHSAYDALRTERDTDGTFAKRLDAWKTGTTGFPMIDACMRMLLETGWINFRMRAMLVSFSSYQLWLHWREPALHLARQFLDYEPGIHYPQVQMQSGTTGINTIRMYNPIKQAKDHDPEGVFVRRWLPELANVPAPYIFEPWTMPVSLQLAFKCEIGTHYPAPIIDLQSASRAARDQVWAVRDDRGFKQLASAIVKQHASRNPAREGIKRRSSKLDEPTSSSQQSLF